MKFRIINDILLGSVLLRSGEEYIIQENTMSMKMYEEIKLHITKGNIIIIDLAIKELKPIFFIRKTRMEFITNESGALE